MIKTKTHRGGCRYTTFKLLQYDKIPVVYREKLSASDSILLELEENLRRRKMRWQETTLGIYKAHQIKRKNPLESTPSGESARPEHFSESLTRPSETLFIVAEYLIKGDTEILKPLTFEKAQQVLLSPQRRRRDETPRFYLRPTDYRLHASSEQLSGPVTDEPTPPAPKSPVILGQESGPKIQLKENQILSVDLSEIIFHQDCHDWFCGAKRKNLLIISSPIFPTESIWITSEDLEGIEIIREAHDVEENIAQMERFLQGSFKVLREHAYCCFYYTPEYHNYLRGPCKEDRFRRSTLAKSLD